MSLKELPYCFFINKNYNMASILRLVMLGPPGSGKGTIGKRIAERYRLQHLVSGHILRDHVRKGTAIGKEAQSYMKEGIFVPDKTMVELMLSEIKGLDSRGWILDGFPRTLSQAEILSEHLTINSIIYLNVPFETIINRITERWIHLPSGRVYNLSFNPPKTPGKDDITGEPLSQREDDHPETITERLKQYRLLTLPLLEFYESKKILASFSGTETDKIWPEVIKHIDKTLLIHTNNN